MTGIHEVTSPLPGTFYTRESPTSPPYVSVGDHVAAGGVIGLVEVMKMFNPVTTEHGGIVVEILLEAEDAVDVGDVLVRIQLDEG